MSDSYNDKQAKSIRIESPSATYFKPSEAPPDKQRKFRYLWRYNEGWKSRSRMDSSQEWDTHRRRMLKNFASQLEFTERQRERAVTLFESIDMETPSKEQNTSLEAYTFCICALVANEDAEPHRPDSLLYLPSKADSNNPERFIELKDQLELTQHETKTAMNQLRREFGNDDS
jgi:hypothetical protein